jgi:hypothetical protein
MVQGRGCLCALPAEVKGVVIVTAGGQLVTPIRLKSRSILCGAAFSFKEFMDGVNPNV